MAVGVSRDKLHDILLSGFN